MGEEKEETRIECLKKEYGKFQKKYSLPSFETLNKNFYIEKIDPSETEDILRETRKFISERVSNYLKFMESILQPVNVPSFVYSVVKCLKKEDKEELKKAYDEISRIEIEIVYVDSGSSEKKEAEFIKKSNEIWEGVMKTINKIMAEVRENYDTEKNPNRKNNYFS